MWLFLVHLLWSVDHIIAPCAVTYFYKYETQMHIQACAETHALVIGKGIVAFLKRNFIFLCTNRVLKCLGMAHSGLFITCGFPFLILCMRQTLVKIIISIQVLTSLKCSCFATLQTVTPVKKNKLFLQTVQRHTKLEHFIYSLSE